MHVGLSVFFQNLDGRHSDGQIYGDALALADLAEPLGFDSVWSAEHHFDGYTMCPNVAQFLTYMAGRTTRALLGSMVTVLPWHDPVRAAEEIAVLDHLSKGRVLLGIGRGLGRIEFEGFRLPMNQSREKFVAHARAILTALETGILESDDPAYMQPRVAIRPKPFKTFKGRVYAAAVSPESARIMAQLGIGLLVIAQKPWETTLAEIQTYRDIYREVNGVAAPKPLVAGWVACHDDAATAEEMFRTYIRRYSRSALEHYEFNNPGLADIKGYEYYGALSRNIAKHGVETFIDFLARLQIWGTPDQVHSRITDYTTRLDAAGFIGVFGYGGMPHATAEANVRLFAKAVLPRLQQQNVETNIGSTL